MRMRLERILNCFMHTLLRMRSWKSLLSSPIWNGIAGLIGLASVLFAIFEFFPKGVEHAFQDRFRGIPVDFETAIQLSANQYTIGEPIEITIRSEHDTYFMLLGETLDPIFPTLESQNFFINANKTVSLSSRGVEMTAVRPAAFERIYIVASTEKQAIIDLINDRSNAWPKSLRDGVNVLGSHAHIDFETVDKKQ